MSNKRRTNRGNQKIARNLFIRLRRGAVKAGVPLPGNGAWRSEYPTDASVAKRSQELKDLMATTDAYWCRKWDKK